MEIEIRAFIDDVGEFKKILKKLGATYEYEAHIIDSWHCDKNGSKFEEVQQDKPGSYGLRIRKQIDKDFSKSELNCKVLKSEGDHNVFYEFESKIHDSEQVGEILKHIGFKVFCTVDKKRTAYKLGKCTVNIEEINRASEMTGKIIHVLTKYSEVEGDLQKVYMFVERGLKEYLEGEYFKGRLKEEIEEESGLTVFIEEPNYEIKELEPQDLVNHKIDEDEKDNFRWINMEYNIDGDKAYLLLLFDIQNKSWKIGGESSGLWG